MSDKTWMSPEELAQCSRAYDVESEQFCSPIPTQNISNGEYLPKPQSEKQKEVEARIKELAAEYLADPNKYVNEVNAFTAPYSGKQNLDAKGAGDAFHFLRFIKSIFLDSQVTVGLISNVTTFVDAQPGTNLPVTNVDEARLAEILTAAQTANARNFINDIAGSRRAMAHGRLYVGRANLEYIQYQTENHRPDAWKGYCITHAAQPGRSALSTSTAPNTAPLDTSSNAVMKLWRHDDQDVAYPTFELISKYYRKLKGQIPGFNNICVHKGLAHGMADIPEFGHPADLPAACHDFPDLNFITYHSCIKDTFFDYFAWQEVVAAERGDRGSTRVVQGQRVPDISWTTEFADLTGRFTNSYAELGTTFASSIITFPTLWAHIIGQLLMFKGENQIVFGSDSLWYGTPQWQLEAFWRFQIPDKIRAKWGYPAITETAKRKILGLNLARLYGLDSNVGSYGAVPTNYASMVPKQLKDLLEFDNGKPNLTAENDNLSKIKARYLETGAQRSNMRYGWLRTRT